MNLGKLVHEVHRTWDTLTIWPWTLVSSSSSALMTTSSPTVFLSTLGDTLSRKIFGNATVDAVPKDSLKWILVQLAVVCVFYRLIAPFRMASSSSSSSSRSTNYGPYYKLRTVLDVWLFTCLALKSPAASETNELSSMRLFVTVFVIFLAASHVCLAAFVVLWHILGFTVNAWWPSLVDLLFLPSGRTFNPPSMTTLVVYSSAVSLATSLVFVGCTIEAKNAAAVVNGGGGGGDALASLPSVCKSIYSSSVTEANDQQGVVYQHLGYLSYLTHLSLWDSPIGLLWLSFLALFVIYYLTRRSTRLALRKRLSAAVRRSASFRRFAGAATDEQLAAAAVCQQEFDDDGGAESSSALFFTALLRRRPVLPLLLPPLPQQQPDFMPMSEWFTVGLIDTAIDVLISIKLFFGRFDPRLHIKPDLGRVAGTFHFGAADESGDGAGDADFVWDWIADTGDGGNSTYAVTNALAAPTMSVRMPTTVGGSGGGTANVAAVELPRAWLLVIGGDLAYPGPSVENYEKRLCVPFADALEPPANYSKSSVASGKQDSEHFYGAAAAAEQQPSSPPPPPPPPPPVCYCIPGNHDMYDGLSAFTRVILGRDWLGGWRLPQTTTYFTLQLPHDWVIFALDQGLGEDIDLQQFRYFRDMASRIKTKSIILVNHEPVWLYDAYAACGVGGATGAAESRSPLLKELLQRDLEGKVALRISGDLHCYMRYQNNTTDNGGGGTHLVVSGGGGAFTHPTHPFPTVVKEEEEPHQLKAAYPSLLKSKQLGFDNLGNGFRSQNWRFDVVGSTLYFATVLSLFPRCGIASRVHVSESTVECFYAYVEELASMLGDMLSTGYASPLSIACALAVCVSFAERERGSRVQLALGAVHFALHLFSALNCFVFVQLVLEIALEDGLVGQSSFALFETYFGGGGATASGATLAKQCLRVLDVPESMAHVHKLQCFTPGVALASSSWSRFDSIAYYVSSYAYLYVLTADVFSVTFGLYLAMCSSMSCQWNESFSALRNADFKHFMRFKIDRVDGTMQCFVLGMDKTPTQWKRNPEYDAGASPSKWIPSKRSEAVLGSPRLVDYFAIKKDLSSS